METFGLLLGHLVGDYILQTDWQAKWKIAWGRDVFKAWQDIAYIEEDGEKWPKGTSRYHNVRLDEHFAAKAETRRGHVACTLHCILYTLAVWAFSFWWMPWWGLLVCFGLHWPIDRFKLASWWMQNVSGQAVFAGKAHPLYPWSVVLIDNTGHLLTLFAILAMH